jgi:hypothetical protein
MTNSRSSPLFRLPRPTNSSFVRIESCRKIQRLGHDDEIFVVGVLLIDRTSAKPFSNPQAAKQLPKILEPAR